MVLKKLALFNFRNYKDFKVDFAETNLILGPNASGKTNLLEAVYLLSTTKSFRTNQNKDLISFGANFSKIGAELENKERRVFLELFLNLEPKSQEVKKKARVSHKFRPLPFLLGTLLTVLFTPEALNMVLGPPPLRRRSLDLTLSLVFKKYTQNLIEFLKILRQRNHLLGLIKERRAKKEELDFWDQGFKQTGSFLQDQRRIFLENLNNLLPPRLRLLYLPSVFRDLRDKEIEAGFSLIGPQKDDFVFLWNKKSLSSFGSRGEVRQGVIFFKLAEWEFIRQKGGYPPLLLLDDIFSELDRTRRKDLENLLFKGQTILTATSLSSVSPEIIKKAKVIELG